MEQHPSEDHVGGVWIKSEPAEDGTYHLVLELGLDDVIPLSRGDAWGWVREMQMAMATAEYDEAVYKQMVAVGESGEDAAELALQTVMSLREERPKFFVMPRLAFELVPGVSAFTGKAFVQIRRKGKAFGQWSREDVDHHTLGVLGAITNLDLDAQYLRLLTDKIDTGRDVALNVVGHLYDFRD